MSTDKFSRRVNHDIYTMRNNVNKIRCTECIVSHQWNLMTVSDVSNLFKIWNVDKWVTQRLNQDKFCIIFDCSFYFFRIVDVNKSCCDTITWECFFQEVKSSTIKRCCSNNMITSVCQTKYYISDSSHT